MQSFSQCMWARWGLLSDAERCPRRDRTGEATLFRRTVDKFSRIARGSEACSRRDRLLHSLTGTINELGSRPRATRYP